MRRQGRIVEWNDGRGFGFVLWHGGDERAFAHISEFAERGVRPAIGDVVTYDLAIDERGRAKARGIRHAGAEAGHERVARDSGDRASLGNRWHGALLIAAVLAAGGWYHDQREQRLADADAAVAADAAVVAQAASAARPLSRPPAAASTVDAATTSAARASSRAPVAATAEAYRCTGKQHCSQMSSCAEAEYYLAHCPDTRMDGDGDGEPCEDMCRRF